jgi:hypothetical protein
MADANSIYRRVMAKAERGSAWEPLIMAACVIAEAIRTEMEEPAGKEVPGYAEQEWPPKEKSCK